MKKTICILLLGILLYNTLGFIVNFQFLLVKWRQEMHVFLVNHAESVQLTKFVFNTSDFDKNTDEFEQEGEYYDVVKTEVMGDSTHVYCYQDVDETRLISCFQDILHQNKDANQDFSKKMLGFFKQLLSEYCFENYLFLQKPTPSVFLTKKEGWTYYPSFFTSLFNGVLTPPPQVA